MLAIEKDTQRYSSFDGSRPHVDERSDESMINLDDPVHQAQRNLVARRFSPGAVQPLTMTALAELGLDESIDWGPVTRGPNA